jgi:hypothetical protein
MDEHLAGTVLMTVVCITPQRMGTAPANRRIRSQLLETRHAEEDPSRAHHWYDAVRQHRSHPRPRPSCTRTAPDLTENMSRTPGTPRSPTKGER